MIDAGVGDHSTFAAQYKLAVRDHEIRDGHGDGPCKVVVPQDRRSPGAYRDADTERLIDRSDAAARNLDVFDRRRLRRAWDALVERIDVSRERVRIILRCEQVRAFLAWPGTGLFKLAPSADARHQHVYVVETEAFAVRSERQFRLPLDVDHGARQAEARPGRSDVGRSPRPGAGLW